MALIRYYNIYPLDRPLLPEPPTSLISTDFRCTEIIQYYLKLYPPIEANPFIRPLFHGRRGDLIRGILFGKKLLRRKSIYDSVCFIPILLISSMFFTALCDIVCQWFATCRWFSPGTQVSSTNKTDHQDITVILLNVALTL